MDPLKLRRPPLAFNVLTSSPRSSATRVKVMSFPVEEEVTEEEDGANPLDPAKLLYPPLRASAYEGIPAPRATLTVGRLAVNDRIPAPPETAGARGRTSRYPRRPAPLTALEGLPRAERYPPEVVTAGAEELEEGV
jgi:hypothetical protein